MNQEDIGRPNGEERLAPVKPPFADEGAKKAACVSPDTRRENAAERRDHAMMNRKRQPKLRQLDAKDVDAVLAEGPGAINSLRDVQVLVEQTFVSIRLWRFLDPSIAIELIHPRFPSSSFSSYIGTRKRAESSP